MKNSTFKALIVLLAAVTVLSGCGDSKKAKKAPINFQNPRLSAAGAAGPAAPGQTVSDISEMPPAEPVQRIGRPAPSKEKSARGKNTAQAAGDSTSNGSTVNEVGEDRAATAPSSNSVTAKPQTAKPRVASTSAKPKPRSQVKAEEPPAVVSSVPLSVNPMSTEMFNQETLVVREIIMKIGSQVGRLSTVGLHAAPVADFSYQQKLLNSEESAYTTTTVFSLLKETGICSLSTTRGCVVFEKDTRSGQTRNRAYYLGTENVAYAMNGEIKVLRAPVSDKTSSADIAEVLKSKSDGIYMYTVTADFSQAESKPVTATKPTKVAKPKPAVTPAPKSAPAATSKPVVVAKPVASPAPVTAPVTIEKRKLGVQIVYVDELQNNENKEAQTSLSEIWNKSDLVKARALKASPTGDENYETRLSSTPQNPKISAATHAQLLSTGACDLNLVGACIVLEKDTVAGKERTAAYYLGSAPQDNWSMVGNINVARRDITDKGLLTKAALLLKNKNNGIYIYSLATKGQNVLSEQKDSMAASVAAAELKQAEELTAAQIDARINVVTDQSEKANAEKAIDEAIAKSTTKTNNRSHANYCSITAVRSDEFPKRGLKTVRRIFIADFVNIASTLGGKEEVPLKIGKGVLYCKLTDGRIQKVNIQITEYISPFTVGVVLSKTNQNLVAGGLGFVNGALDILNTRDFGALVEVDAMALVGGFSVAPIILSDGRKRTPFVLAGQISVTPQWMFLNVRVSVGTRFEVIVDPDDT